MQIPEFGIKRENEERRDGGVGIVFDPATKKFGLGKQWESGLYRLFSGGVDAGEDMQEGTLREVREESGLHDFAHIEKLAEALSHYYNSLRNVNRVAHATCYLIILKSADLKPVHLEEHEKFSLAWATAEEIFKNWEGHNQNHDLDHWLYFMDKALTRLKELGYEVKGV
jgi:8-oxo-dGTP pyrophosphatase MutT (NUDIX family)